MQNHLWPLLRLKAESQKALREAYRKVYLEAYVRGSDGQEIQIFDWLGNRVRFSGHPKFFDHAFSESSSYRFGSGVHDLPFSEKRARCIFWIKEVLAASRGTIERRLSIRKDSRGRKKKRRVFIVLEERYCVVLEETNEQGVSDFVTAFPADLSYLERIRRESNLIEIKKPQS